MEGKAETSMSWRTGAAIGHRVRRRWRVVGLRTASMVRLVSLVFAYVFDPPSCIESGRIGNVRDYRPPNSTRNAPGPSNRRARGCKSVKKSLAASGRVAHSICIPSVRHRGFGRRTVSVGTSAICHPTYQRQRKAKDVGVSTP